MATLTTNASSVVYDVDDIKIYPLLTDVAGASPTFGAGFDIPGAAEIGCDPNLITAELRGDSRIIARKGRTDHVVVKAKWGKLALGVMQAMMGGIITAAGTTPNSKAGYRLASPAPLPYFRLDFRIVDLDLGYGDLWGVVYKCQLTGGTLIDTTSNAFAQPSLTADGIGLEGDLTQLDGSGTDTGVMVDFVYRETAVALTTTAVMTP